MRLTVDLDSWWFQDLQRMIAIAYNLGLGFPAELKRSPSRKGYHATWYNVPENKVVKFRELLGDDARRIKKDVEMHEKPKQVLFTKKKYVILRR